MTNIKYTFFKQNYSLGAYTIQFGQFNLIQNRLFTDISPSKINTLEIKSMIKLPKININRNQKRLTNTVRAIVSYIENQTMLHNSIKMELATLLQRLEILYFRDPKGFCITLKLLSNWFKVNVGRNTRQQDAIPNDAWSPRFDLPNLLIPVMDVLKNHCRTNLEIILVYRLILTCLEIYRVVTVPQEPKLETITNPYTGKENALDGINIPRALRNLDIDPDKIHHEYRAAERAAVIHSTSAQGPNGQAVWMSHIDAKALLDDTNLMDKWVNYVAVTLRKDLPFILRNCVSIPQFFTLADSKPLHSKLHFIFEKGDKVRTIAILDWFTQEALCPLHDTIAGILKGMEQDGTFDQDKISSKVKAFTSNSNLDLCSLDLTAATDRLPVDLQVRVLEYLLDIEGFGQAWKELLTDRTYTLPHGDGIRYAVGQPMGAKSSFPMLGLTHHIIVQEAASRVGIDRFRDYVILGDDIVIANVDVANMYMTIMRDLGLDISMHKSIISIQSNRQFAIAEICRRLFIDGVEVTPIPVNLLANAIENQDMLYQLQEEFGRKGLINNVDKLPEFFASIISSQDSFDRLSIMNGLPQSITNMKTNMLLDSNPKFLASEKAGFRGIGYRDLINLYTFVTLVEQLKRLGSLMNQTKGMYDLLMKAADVCKAQFIGFQNDDMIHIQDLSEEAVTGWKLDEVLHPAKLVVRNETDRIAVILMKMSVLSGQDLLDSLKLDIVDRLKVSIISQSLDNRLADSRVAKTLIDKTIDSIDKILEATGNELSYSIKLNQFNIVWTLKFKLGSEIRISRSASNISTTVKDSSSRLNKFRSRKE